MTRLLLPILACAALLAASAAHTQSADAACSPVQGIARGGCVVVKPPARTGTAPSATQLLERMRSTYEALRSYIDSGTVLSEQQSVGSPLIAERHRFVTGYAAPRRFIFDFRKNGDAERFVIWCPGDTFHSWWSATQVHEAYAKGEGATAFAIGTLPTGGAALLVPALLLQAATLQGPLLALKDARHVGSEAVGGRLAHRLQAAVRVNHWSDATRTTTVWIDAESHLVRKVVEDTPSGFARGAIDRVTTTFEPQADTALSDATFRFTPPR